MSSINSAIAAHVREGCGIGSIARLLHISDVTVISSIQKIADAIEKPAVPMGRLYGVDELKTYVKRKTNDYWIAYAVDKESKLVVGRQSE